MLVALVDITVVPNQRACALAALQGIAAETRALPGCQTYRPVADPGDDGRITVIHEWQSAADFDAYLASAGFAQVGEVLRGLMTAPPASRRYNAALIEPAA